MSPKFTVKSGSTAAHTIGYDEPPRTIPLNAYYSQFGDTFTKYQVHLYRLS